MSILKKLTENVVHRDLAKDSAALVKKWEATGLLEGLTSDQARDGMAVLLENQAKELLREVSSMSQGDVEGFASVAFPIVRRVFGNLIANDLVSVQPMSLPSGLIFFLDFLYTDSKAMGGATAAQSMYGGGRVGVQITGGLELTQMSTATGLWNVEKGFYSLNNGYSSPTGSVTLTTVPTLRAVRSGSGAWAGRLPSGNSPSSGVPAAYTSLGDALILNDPDLSGSAIGIVEIPTSTFTNLNVKDFTTIHTNLTGAQSAFGLVKRLTRYSPISGSSVLQFVFASYNSGSVDGVTNIDTIGNITGALPTFTYAIDDALTAGGALGSVVGTTPWGLEGTSGTLTGTGTNIDIPEIEIRVDSMAVTAKTKKLKAKWTPELGQDLNAYHNIDAEVELTSILSEQIGLELDQEILVDLIKGATGATYFWSRMPGKFVNRLTGVDITANGTTLPSFTGNVSMWYETLLEVVNDASAQIHRKTLKGGANFMVCGPEVCSILEMTSGFRASVSVDDEKGSAGVINAGSVSKKWDVYVDPYFPRNVILIGRRGKSFLESGFVYAPYVPLQVTPTIFGVEDFVPRKGVMTRYAKAMVKPDMYGLIVVQDMMMP